MISYARSRAELCKWVEGGCGFLVFLLSCSVVSPQLCLEKVFALKGRSQYILCGRGEPLKAFLVTVSSPPEWLYSDSVSLSLALTGIVAR